MTVRLAADEAAYTAAKKQNDLRTLYQEDPIKDYTFWRIVKNRFPHSKLADENHILVLKRACSFETIALHEWQEFIKIVSEISAEYDNMVYNFPSLSSVRGIPHCHLYRLKPEFK